VVYVEVEDNIWIQDKVGEGASGISSTRITSAS
jgi:hypothetical protein